MTTATFRNRIYNSITETIGATPLVRLHQIEKKYQLKAQLLAKLEFFNPNIAKRSASNQSTVISKNKKDLLFSLIIKFFLLKKKK